MKKKVRSICAARFTLSPHPYCSWLDVRKETE